MKVLCELDVFSKFLYVTGPNSKLLIASDNFSLVNLLLCISLFYPPLDKIEDRDTSQYKNTINNKILGKTENPSTYYLILTQGPLLQLHTYNYTLFDVCIYSCLGIFMSEPCLPKSNKLQTTKKIICQPKFSFYTNSIMSLLNSSKSFKYLL